MFRTAMMMVAVACFAAGCMADSGEAVTGSVEQATGNEFDCSKNVVSVNCLGSIKLLNIDVDVEDNDVDIGDVLSDNDIDVLSNDLNNLKIELEDILNISNIDILNNVEAEVLNDFLNKFDIDFLQDNEVNVCQLVLGIKVLCT